MSKPRKPKAIKAPTFWTVETMKSVGLTVRDARKLAKWLLDYANYLVEEKQP